MQETQLWLYLLGLWNPQVCSCCFTCYQDYFSKRTAVYLFYIVPVQLHKNTSVAYFPVTSFHFSVSYWGGCNVSLYCELSGTHLWPPWSGNEIFLHGLALLKFLSLLFIYFYFYYSTKMEGKIKLEKKSVKEKINLVSMHTWLTLYWLNSEFAEFATEFEHQVLFFFFCSLRNYIVRKRREKEKEKEPNCRESRLLERQLNFADSSCSKNLTSLQEREGHLTNGGLMKQTLGNVKSPLKNKQLRFLVLFLIEWLAKQDT